MPNEPFKLEGIGNVMENLHKRLVQIKGRSMRGLIEVAILIRRDMEDTPPLIPVDKGNLRASWFTVTSSGFETGGSAQFEGKSRTRMAAEHRQAVSQARSSLVGKQDPVLIMGFSANYAWWVHENIGAKFKRPNAGAQFFRASIERNVDDIIRIIQKNARI